MADIIEAAAVDVLAPVQQEGTKAAVRGWLAAVGDTVREGDPLVELETDKVTVEVPAPASGTLVEILIPTDQDAAPGAVLGQIGTSQDALRVASPRGGRGRARAASGRGLAPASTTSLTRSRGALRPLPQGGGGDAKSADRFESIADFDPALRLSPSVRKLLVETGLDPAGLGGSGKDGRLTRAGCRAGGRPPPGPAGRAAAEAKPASVASAPTASRTTPCAGASPSTWRIRSPRRRMSPPFRGRFRRRAGASPGAQGGVRAPGRRPDRHRLSGPGLRRRDEGGALVNSRWHDDALEVFDDVGIGIGTALGDKGLVVPVVHRAQSLSLLGIAARLQEATALARAGRLAPADVQGGTFTISNHGVSGSLLAAPIIINQPQVAILGVGKVEKRVVVREAGGADAMLIRPMAYVSLTIDHRALDGAQTNAWLARFVETIETWPAE